MTTQSSLAKNTARPWGNVNRDTLETIGNLIDGAGAQSISQVARELLEQRIGINTLSQALLEAEKHLDYLVWLGTFKKEAIDFTAVGCGVEVMYGLPTDF